jgi:transcriptional repressor NrdR
MQCPFCHAADTKVTDSRVAGEGGQVRRRRECLVCLERFTTYENIEYNYPLLVKRDGSRVQFKLENLKRGLLRAMEKRPVSTEAIEAGINRLLSRLRNLGERELETRVLGEWVMAELRNLDEVAYLRFASVYRRFQDIHEFNQEIARLQAGEPETHVP